MLRPYRYRVMRIAGEPSLPTQIFRDAEWGGRGKRAAAKLVVGLTDQTLSCARRAAVMVLTSRGGSAAGPKPGRASFYGELGGMRRQGASNGRQTSLSASQQSLLCQRIFLSCDLRQPHMDPPEARMPAQSCKRFDRLRL
jgi:hypothetical protein